MLVASVASAAPRVVVSIPSLHSLVSALMDGVAEPTLLLEQDGTSNTTLDFFQKGEIIASDMLVWVGSGHESSMAQVIQQWPVMDNKLITLSNYIPLFARDHYQGDLSDRQQSRNFYFWHDPHLAVMAVRYITPQLVRLDPDHQEQYLDNEIALIKKLKHLEHEVGAMFESRARFEMASVQGFDRYFMNRFLKPEQLVKAESSGLRTVSLKGQTTCPAQNSSTQLHPGLQYYFDSMLMTAKTVIDCLKLDPV